MATQDLATRIQGIVSENVRLESENTHLRSQLEAISAAMGMTLATPAPASPRKATKTKTAVNSSVKAARKNSKAKTRTTPALVPMSTMRELDGTIGYVADGMAYAITYERDYTWLFFQAKPSRDVLDLLGKNGMGGWFTKKRGPAGGWGFSRIVQASEFATIIGA